MGSSDSVAILPHRSERLIAAGRAILAALSLLAIWLDPTEPSRFVGETYTVLAGYVAYAGGMLATVWRLGPRVDRFALPAHLVDVPLFGLLIFLTEGAASPFFAFFIFALLAAALRWQARGVVWTGLAVLIVYAGVSLFAAGVLHDPGFELHRFLIRIGYLAVVVLLLGYLSGYEQQLREQRLALAAWPRVDPDELPVGRGLDYAGHILGASRIALTFEEEDEPYAFQASYDGTSVRLERDPDTSLAGLVPEALSEADFLCGDLLDPGSPLIGRTGAVLQRFDELIGPAERRRFGARSLISVRLQGRDVRGRLFVLDKPDLTLDDLAAVEIIARQIAADLDLYVSRKRLRLAALTEERVRFARDLHDGLLQSLTGLGLQLKVLERTLEQNPAEAKARLAVVQDLLGREQQDLRFFVRQMKPLALSRDQVNAGLASHLEELVQRSERQWDLEIDLEIAPLPRQLNEALAHATYRITQEALVNAARHGAARHVRVRIGDGERLRLRVQDDGRGFPFEGRFDLAALAAAQQGPLSIMQRVVALGGDLTLETGPSGTLLTVDLPLPADPQLAGLEAAAGSGGAS